ncbi:class I SAM-dependent methyltransferase [Kineococcus aurantiacus]|nr:class I SAM-dependent methyltransferase [Kineococcus aurantiacus]
MTDPRRVGDPAAPRRADGSAGDADYGGIGTGYSTYRRPEPVVAAAIEAALGPAVTVLNVGAGAGSYEPADRRVTAVEPSATMRRQRPPHLSVAVDATAEHLPFDDGAFDAAMATFTVHQWPDLAAGLAEVRRVTRGPVLVLTCDPAALEASWLTRYAPEVIATEARRYPAIAAVERALTAPGGGWVRVQPVDVPLGCVDGFSEAYYGRPELLLDPGARRANSAWSFVGPDVERRFERTLRADLASGAWDREFGHLRRQPSFAGSLRLVTGHRSPNP